MLCLWRIGWSRWRDVWNLKLYLNKLSPSCVSGRFPGYTAPSFRGTIAINPIPPTATTTESEIYCVTARNIWSSCTSLSGLSFTSQYNVSLRKTNELVWVFFVSSFKIVSWFNTFLFLSFPSFRFFCLSVYTLGSYHISKVVCVLFYEYIDIVLYYYLN